MVKLREVTPPPKGRNVQSQKLEIDKQLLKKELLKQKLEFNKFLDKNQQKPLHSSQKTYDDDLSPFRT